MPMPVELQYALQSLYVPGAVVIGFIIGLTFADIDLAPPLPLRHRSVWTHSPIIPFTGLYGSSDYGLFPQTVVRRV
jgi:hypothetical protein